MAVFRNTSGKWVASYNGTKQYFSSQSAAMKAYDAMKSSSSGSSGGSSGGSTAPKETVAETVARAKAMLGDAYDPNTKAPTASQLDAIANQSFISPEVKAAYDKTKLSPVNQNYISEQYNSTLLRASAPTVASDITSLNQTTTPTDTPTYGQPGTAYAGVMGIDTYEQQRQKDLDAEKERRLQAEKERQKESQKLWDRFLGDSQSPTEVGNEAWDEIGINAKEHFAKIESITKEVDTLNTQYNNIEAARDQQIAETTGMMASMSFIDNRTAQIRRNAAPEMNRISAEINSKAALMEALRGNFADAQTYVRQAVEDATADLKFRADMYQSLYDQNLDNFNAVESIYRDSYTAKMEEERLAYDRAYAEKSQVGQMMIANPQAGIKITDTLDQAFAKIGLNPMSPERRLLEAQIANTWDNANGGGDTPGSSSNFIDIMQQAIDAGASPEQAAREAATASELAGVPVNQDTLEAWTEQARKLSPTVQVAPQMNESVSSPITSYSVGKSISNAASSGVNSVGNFFLKAPQQVGSFFSGLFGG